MLEVGAELVVHIVDLRAQLLNLALARLVQLLLFRLYCQITPGNLGLRI